MDSIPTSFDWVAARAKCSLGAVFAALAEVIDSDVKNANALPLRSGVSFMIERPVNRKVIVSRQDGPDFVAGVVFELTQQGIAVRVADARQVVLFTAKPSMLADGRCLLEVDGQSLELWQVSQKALESLFFENVLSTAT